MRQTVDGAFALLHDLRPEIYIYKSRMDFSIEQVPLEIPTTHVTRAADWIHGENKTDVY